MSICNTEELNLNVSCWMLLNICYHIYDEPDCLLNVYFLHTRNRKWGWHMYLFTTCLEWCIYKPCSQSGPIYFITPIHCCRTPDSCAEFDLTAIHWAVSKSHLGSASQIRQVLYHDFSLHKYAWPILHSFWKSMAISIIIVNMCD